MSESNPPSFTPRPGLFGHVTWLSMFYVEEVGVDRGSTVLSKKVTVWQIGKAGEPGACKKFVKRAMKAAMKVKFVPAKKGGAAVSQYAMFQYNYNVR